MREDILRFVERCETCHTSFMPRAGEVCKCPEPAPADEETYVDYEDPLNPLAEAHRQ